MDAARCHRRMPRRARLRRRGRPTRSRGPGVTPANGSCARNVPSPLLRSTIGGPSCRATTRSRSPSVSTSAGHTPWAAAVRNAGGRLRHVGHVAELAGLALPQQPDAPRSRRVQGRSGSRSSGRRRPRRVRCPARRRQRRRTRPRQVRLPRSGGAALPADPRQASTGPPSPVSQTGSTSDRPAPAFDTGPAVKARASSMAAGWGSGFFNVEEPHQRPSDLRPRRGDLGERGAVAGSRRSRFLRKRTRVAAARELSAVVPCELLQLRLRGRRPARPTRRRAASIAAVSAAASPTFAASRACSTRAARLSDRASSRSSTRWASASCSAPPWRSLSSASA